MAGSDLPRALCLLGPTAAGKTGVAVALARAHPVDVISVDSAMVYRHMNIGTAKPSPALRREVPHALIDIREPWESYSAGEFAADARRLITASHAAGRTPLLVGGTLLYFRALQQGLAPLPGADAEIRRELDATARSGGWPALHRELSAVDPLAAARIAPQDRQRIQRALEVYRLTGEPISALREARPEAPGVKFFSIALVPGDRAALYERIEKRFAKMLDAGFIDEVSRLRRMPEMAYSPPSMRAVGYRQIWAHLEGETDRGEAERRALVATRRYAKRQLTWLRSEQADLRLDCLRADTAAAVTRAAEGWGVL